MRGRRGADGTVWVIASASLFSIFDQMRCHNCDKLAIPPEGGEIPLCLDCQHKMTEISEAKQAVLARFMNFNLAMMESKFGMPLPRYPEPKPKTQYNMQHINLEGANVGIVNTGNIKELNGSVSVMAQSGESDLSKAFAEFIQSVLDTKSLEQAQREEILERLNFIAQQATKPKTERSKILLPTMLLELSGLVSGVEALSALYARHLKPLLDSLVG